MQLTYHVIDAFAAKPFEGNPAGVCVLDAWLPNATMQAIAAVLGARYLTGTICIPQ